MFYTERWFLRWRVLLGPASEHNSIGALHPGHSAVGWLLGNSRTTVARLGAIRKYGALRVPEHADFGVWRW